MQYAFLYYNRLEKKSIVTRKTFFNRRFLINMKKNVMKDAEKRFNPSFKLMYHKNITKFKTRVVKCFKNIKNQLIKTEV